VILLALALPLAAAAQDTNGEEAAEPRRYAVEVIVFEYTEDVFVGSEVFPPEEADDATDPAAYPADENRGADEATGPVPVFGDVETVPAPADPVDDEFGGEEDSDEASVKIPVSKIDALLLPSDALSMDRTFAQLDRLDVYRPLLYAGWEQDSQPKEDAEPVPLTFFGPLPEGLDGSLTLYLGRFLHLVVDLALESETSPELPGVAVTADGWWEEVVPSYGDDRRQQIGQVEGELRIELPRVVYRISDDRILRNGETRYFDHPKFGVVARITRVEKPEEDPAPDEALPLISGPGE
jgi:hypothetical protein